VPFLLLARTFEACSETTKRLEKDVLLTNALRSIIATTPEDLSPAVYLASCSIAPAYQSMKLGIGEQTMVKALAEATGRSEASVKEMLAKTGDLGVVAQQCRSTQRIMFQPAPLTIRGVFSSLRDIARMEGDKSNERKRTAIKRLLVAARELEAGYLVRLLLGDLRVGLQQQTVVASVAHAALLQEDAAAKKDNKTVLKSTALADRLGAADAVLKQVHSECPSWDLILPALLRDGVHKLPETCHFVPGVPVMPMLSKPTSGASFISSVASQSTLTVASQALARSSSASATWNSRASTSTMASAFRSMYSKTAKCAHSAATWRTQRRNTPTSWRRSRST
jgi:DNA ligase 1